MAFLFLLLCYFLLGGVFLALRYALLPNIEWYKPEIEKFASQTLGRPLSIQTIRAGWDGVNPELILENVQISDQAGQAGLVLPKVNASLSWWSLAVLDLRFKNLDISNPRLSIRRQADGKLFVAGFLIQQTQAKNSDNSDEQAFKWLLAQPEIHIRHAQMHWNDQLSGMPELILRDVNFVLKNQWLQHKFALTATPPTELSAPLDIRGNFQHLAFFKKISDRSSWSGDLYAYFNQANLHLLSKYLNLPLDLRQGSGTVRSWIHLSQGRIADLTADLSLDNVLGKLRTDLPLLDMAKVSGRIIASEHATFANKYLPMLFGEAGHSIALIDFTMRNQEGLTLPATTIREDFIPGTRGAPEKVQLYAKLLDLDALANFAEHLPLPSDQLQMLQNFNPRGQLQEFSAKWQGRFPEISNYAIRGKFINLSMQPQAAQIARPKTAKLPARAAIPAIPGFENLSGSIDANEKGGNFALASSNLSVRLPGYFMDPVLPFERLTMQARWMFEANQRWFFQVSQLDFLLDGMSASLTGQHSMSMQKTKPDDLGEVNFTGKLNGFEIKRIARFIPVQAPEHLKNWLSQALQGGTADDVSFRLKGDLAYFPFNKSDPKAAAKGEFLVKGAIHNGKLDFAPGLFASNGKAPLWPAIEAIQGSFVFDRARMEIKAETAKSMELNLLRVKAQIPDLLVNNSMLQIDGTVQGALQEQFNYVKESPVDGWTGHFLQDAKATEKAQIGLKLLLPLNHIIDAKVQGTLEFGNNEVLLQPGIPLISSVHGKLDFNEMGVNLTNLKGNVLGGPTIASGGSQKDGSLRIKLDGLATADGIRKNFPIGSLDKITDKISGNARYTAQINVRRHQTELLIDSNLLGMGLNFPEPLKKAVSESLPLHFEMIPAQNSDAQAMRDEIKLSLGSTMNAHYERRKSLDKNALWQVVKGGIGVNQPVTEPENGIHAALDVKRLNLDEWRKMFAAGVSAKAQENSSAAMSNAVNKDNLINLSAYLEPKGVWLKTSELLLMGKKLENLKFSANYKNGEWQAEIDSKQIAGNLIWTDAVANNSQNSNQNTGQTQSQSHLKARFSHLSIPKTEKSDVAGTGVTGVTGIADIIEAKNFTGQLPSINIIAENFELFHHKLGRLELLADNIPSDQGREWQISKLVLKNDDAELSSSGKWLVRSGEGATDLTYAIEVANAGKLLDRFGFYSVLMGGKGKLAGEIRWNGLPYDLDIPSLSGRIQLDLSSGQFIKVEPGAAKLLGVLSMQSLTRRLSLDFRDVFSDGFAFDTITASASIAHGVATTRNFKMRSVNAAVLIDGSADLAHETQDLHVAIIPEINAGTASVAYALVNPAIGLGTFLAQVFLREPLARAFTYEYKINGPWQDPQVSKFISKSGVSNPANTHELQSTINEVKPAATSVNK